MTEKHCKIKTFKRYLNEDGGQINDEICTVLPHHFYPKANLDNPCGYWGLLWCVGHGKW